MIHLRIKELLKQQKKTKYWFVKKMEGGYQAITRMMEDDTKAIYFDTLEKMCDILECDVSELIVRKKERKKK